MPAAFATSSIESTAPFDATPQSVATLPGPACGTGVRSTVIMSIETRPTIAVRNGREVYGFCFTPQDGNSLLSSIAATLWHIDPDPESVSRRLQPIRRWVYEEI